MTIENFAELAQGATELEVKVRRGDVKARAGGDLAWNLAWTSDGDEPPEIRREGSRLRIEQRHWTFGPSEMDLEITLPAGVEKVDMHTGHGDVEADGLAGRLSLHSGHGDVTLRRGRGEAKVNSGHGELLVEEFEGDVKGNTGNGEIQIARIRGAAKFNSGHGEIHVRGVAGQLDLNTGNGEIQVADAEDLAASFNTGHGEIAVQGGSLTSLRARSGKGDLSSTARLMPGRYEMTTGFGDVEVVLPDDARARIDCQTGFGEVSSAFPLVRVGRSGPMGFGGVRMVGSVGSGEPEIELIMRTGKGDFAIRSASGAGTTVRTSATAEGAAGSFATSISTFVERTIRDALEPLESTFGPPRRRERDDPTAPQAPNLPPTPPPAPPELDLQGAVRSSQTPISPSAPVEGSDASRSAAAPVDPTLAILESVARGEITPEEADGLLRGGSGR